MATGGCARKDGVLSVWETYLTYKDFAPTTEMEYELRSFLRAVRSDVFGVTIPNLKEQHLNLRLTAHGASDADGVCLFAKRDAI